MNYIYNQMVFRNQKNQKILVKFIYYRQDLNTIVYDFEDSIYQCPIEEITVANKDDIFYFYEEKINLLRKHLKYYEKECNNYKQLYKENRRIMINIDSKLNEVKEKLFCYKIANTIIDNNNDKQFILLKKECNELESIKEELKSDYKINFTHSQHLINKVIITKKQISNYKIKRNKIIQEGIYIEN